MGEGVRIDKWLWSVRLYKTRSIATDACRTGKVMMNDVPVKPSRELQVNDVIVVRSGVIKRTLQVRELLSNRVSAKLVENYMIDLTPPEELDKLKFAHEMNHEYRQRGIGRPTKKERRLIEKLKKSKF
jgi:ribosome-associated heat shock protein Hsp15